MPDTNNFLTRFGQVLQDYSRTQQEGPGWRERERHNRAMEAAAENRIQRDLDIAEARRKTAKEIADIRAQTAKDKLELDKIAEARKENESAWRIKRETAKDKTAADKADRDYQLNEKRLAQQWKIHSENYALNQNRLSEKQYEFDYPVPAKLPEDRIESTDPATRNKTVIHVPKGEIERRATAKKLSDEAAAEAQRKANESRNLWQRLRGVNLPVPPMPETNAPAIPTPSAAIRPPRTFGPIPMTGTATAPAVPVAAPPIPAAVGELPIPRLAGGFDFGSGLSIPPLAAATPIAPNIGFVRGAPVMIPPAMPETNATAPQFVPTNAPPAVAPTNKPTDTDIDYLRRNPGKRALFEKRFGEGSALEYLQ